MNSNLTKANDFYRKALQHDGLCAVLKIGRLEKAVTIYREEIKEVKEDCRPSLLRNLGMAHLKIAGLTSPKLEFNILIYHLAEAVESFTKALVLRQKDLNAEWGERVQERILDCFEKAFRSVDGDITFRLPKFYLFNKIHKAIGPEKFLDFVRVQFHLARGRYFYRCGVTTLDHNDFKTTLQLVEYGHEDIETSLTFCGEDVLIQEDIIRFEEDNSFLRFSCESMRMRNQADDLFNYYVKDAEEVNFEMMWEVLDMYKDAAIKTREKDIENEALALSRQGRIFDKIFKIRSKAHSYYRAAFDLAQCLYPRDLNKVAWYLECKEVLERFQQDILREEQEKAEKEKAPILLKLAPELKELKKIHEQRDAYKLLNYIYTNHPPKVKYEFNEKELDSSTAKKFIMKAISYYHPDKQGEFEIEWRVLCDEITKCLTARYECYKG